MTQTTPKNPSQSQAAGRLSPRVRFVLVAAAALALTAVIRAMTGVFSADMPDFQNPWDHHKYIWMATQAPFGFHVAPFCWRVGVPAVVAILPLDTQTGFALVSFASIWLSGIAVFYLARTLDFSEASAAVGVAMFYCLGWAVRSNLFNVWKPDPTAFLLATLAIREAVKGRAWRYALLLAAGVAVKESVLFVAPLYYTLRAHRRVDGALALRAVLLAAPAVVVLTAIRTAIPMYNWDPEYLKLLPETLKQVQLGSSEYDPVWLWRHIGAENLKAFGLGTALEYTAGTFGVAIAALPFFAPRKTARLLLRFSPFLLLVLSQSFFATNAAKLLVIAFPAVIPMALGGVEAVARRLRVPVWSFGAIFLAILAAELTRTGVLVLPYRWGLLFFGVFVAACAGGSAIRRVLATRP